MRINLKQYDDLIKVVKLLNSSLDFAEIKNVIIEQAKKIFNAEASSLMFLDKGSNELYFDVATGEKKEIVKEIRIPSDKGIAGWIIKNKKSILVKDVKQDGRFYNKVDEKSEFITKSIIGTPVYVEGEVIGLIEVLNKKDGGNFKEKDLELLEIFADLASLNLKNAIWHNKAIEKERYESELRVAEKIQKKLIGDHNIDIEGYDYIYKYKACKSVGGDYYDIIPYGKDKYLFTIADVSGKGVPTSMIMSSLRSYLKTFVHFNLSLKECINFINSNIYKDTDVKRFITMIVGILDIKKHIFKFINAGHLFPLVLSSENIIKEVKSNDIPIGVFKNYDFSINSVNVNKGDKVLMFTDGLIEAMDEKNNLYGEDKLEEDIKKLIKKGYFGLENKIFECINNFSNKKQHDDMTFLSFRRRS
ncbi:MAG TPA: GAF domain-containing SpoIIE family protein phosphatase [Candidatus Mcinerneyibacterium sp.]|nr:GAF domain-containing SpoIIE family protein phosphatase [Candidatus Mcinerneyibacterium sp.]